MGYLFSYLALNKKSYPLHEGYLLSRENSISSALPRRRIWTRSLKANELNEVLSKFLYGAWHISPTPIINYQIKFHFCGDYLLSQVKPTIIGLGLFHDCVRYGNRWDKPSIIATEMYNWCGGEVWEQVEQCQHSLQELDTILKFFALVPGWDRIGTGRDGTTPV